MRQSRTITDDLLVAAARALADVVTADELGPNYIIPSVFHPDVASAVAAAVRGAASGRTRPGRGRPGRGRRDHIRPGRTRRRQAKQLGRDDEGHMDEMAMESLTGRLLVATPVLADPNFRRTVVLIVEHEPAEGTLGVVLNRPTDVPVGRVLEPWSQLVTGPSVVFRGGPVAPDSALAIALVPGDAEPLGWHSLAADPAMSRLGSSISTRRRTCSRRPSTGSACTPATPAGRPAS